jgi:hypothetical protein
LYQLSLQFHYLDCYHCYNSTEYLTAKSSLIHNYNIFMAIADDIGYEATGESLVMVGLAHPTTSTTNFL